MSDILLQCVLDSSPHPMPIDLFMLIAHSPLPG